MNRTDFMTQLEYLLQSISPSEREEALQYYNERPGLTRFPDRSFLPYLSCRPGLTRFPDRSFLPYLPCRPGLKYLLSLLFGLLITWFAFIFAIGVAALCLFIVLIALLVITRISAAMAHPFINPFILSPPFFCHGAGSPETDGRFP